MARGDSGVGVAHLEGLRGEPGGAPGARHPPPAAADTAHARPHLGRDEGGGVGVDHPRPPQPFSARGLLAAVPKGGARDRLEVGAHPDPDPTYFHPRQARYLKAGFYKKKRYHRRASLRQNTITDEAPKFRFNLKVQLMIGCLFWECVRAFACF